MFKRAIIVLSIVLSILGVVVIAAAIDAHWRHQRRSRAEPGDQPALTVAAPAPPPTPTATPTPTPVWPPATPARRRAPAPGSGPAPTPVLDAPAFADEAALMARLHELGESNPALSLQLARASFARFPDGPDAPERNWILVKSLVNLERFDEARAEGRAMVNRYPNAPWSQDVQRHLLTNPP